MSSPIVSEINVTWNIDRTKARVGRDINYEYYLNVRNSSIPTGEIMASFLGITGSLASVSFFIKDLRNVISLSYYGAGVVLAGSILGAVNSLNNMEKRFSENVSLGGRDVMQEILDFFARHPLYVSLDVELVILRHTFPDGKAFDLIYGNTPRIEKGELVRQTSYKVKRAYTSNGQVIEL